jgi:spermidine synthase
MAPQPHTLPIKLRQRGAEVMTPVLMVASGFAGLGYQVVWTQQCALWLGHEAAAVLAVVAAFFGGLALGAWGLSKRIEASAQPARWYAACEAAIALWGLVLLLWMAPLSQFLLALTGEQPTPLWQWLVAFVGTLLMLLPATAAMGATLPAIERVLAALQDRSDGTPIALLYASNTLGAVVGVLTTVFWFVPTFGLQATAGLCVLLNAACAVAAWTLFNNTPAKAKDATPMPAGAGLRSLYLLVATGLLGIGFEVMVVRVLSQVAEDTVYTFAMLLAIYLVGTAIGAAVYQRLWASHVGADGAALTDRLLCALAVACVLASLSLWGGETVRDSVLQSLGANLSAALLAEAAMAALAFVLPTLVMGALFSHLCVQALAQGQRFGKSLGLNTLGAAVAPVLFGVLLAPALGAKWVLVLIASGYLLLLSKQAWRTPKAWGAATAAVALAVATPRLAFINMPDGGQLLSYQEGALGAVSVVQDTEGTRRLHINNRQQEGASDSWFADARQAVLPMLLHPAPRRALFLGVGSGVTSSAAGQDANVRVDAVDLLPEVIAATAYFRSVAGGEQPLQRLHLMNADARRFVRTTAARYDLVVSDNFHPARSGAGSLYTVEHFAAVRASLAEGGVFCQWLPLHQMDLATLRSVVRSFIQVYPGAGALLATNSLQTPVIGLIAQRDGKPFDADAVARRLQTADAALRYEELGLVDAWALWGSFIAGPQALQRFAADAPLNTDDRPVVAYHAPRITYAPDSLPRERLTALLRELRQPTPTSPLLFSQPQMAARLVAYQQARDEFLAAGQQVRPVADPQAMLAQVREPLLAVLRSSPDFRPAYDPLLGLAQAVAVDNAAQARALLEDLRRLQPARAEAAAALATMPP